MVAEYTTAGRQRTLDLLKELIEKNTHQFLSEASSTLTALTPSHTFWVVAYRLFTVTPSTLHSLQKLHTTSIHLLTSFTHAFLPTLGNELTNQLQQVVYDHMIKMLSENISSPETLKELVKLLSLVFVVSDASQLLCKPLKNSVCDKIANDIISKGPKLVFEVYKECVQDEIKNSCVLKSTTCTHMLKVSLLL